MSASKIGRFEIISEVAHSEYSSVYKATDTVTSRPVALKAFNLDLAGDGRADLVQRLLHEAESTRSLSHQNIVSLFGAGEIDGRFCVATEYVEGFTVATHVAKGERFTVWDMVDMSRQVCNGLDHAVSQGVIHKRLHPANVLVQWDGTTKILGFGITGMWSEEDSLGLLSPASYYASPEQVRGEALDARSNLYSWGAILYAMSTGHAPSEVADHPSDQPSDVESVRRQILEGTPVPPIQLNPKLIPALNDLILKALSKNPEDRYQSGRELLVALEGCKEAPKSASPAPKPPVVPKVAAPPAAKAAAAAVGAHSHSGADNLEIDAKPASRFASPVVRASAGVAEEEDAAGIAKSPAFTPSSSSSGQRSSGQRSSGQPGSAEPAPAHTKIGFDPMMAGETPAGGGGRSFSEISELPPLKQQYAPSISLAPESVAETEPDPAPAVTLSRSATGKGSGKKKLTLPAMPQVDTKLLVHGVIGGLAVILLVAALVFLYVNTHTTDDEGSIPPPKPAAQTDTEAPAADSTPAQDALAQETAPAAQPESQVRAQESPRSAAAAASGARGRKTKEVAAKAVPVAAAGQLLLDSTPQGAQIQIDGRFDSTWVTPFTLSGIAPGQHTVTATKQGYGNEVRALNVASGSKSVLAIQLNAVSAAIAVSSDPAGAAIWVDGRDSGRVTPAQVTLEKGSHTVLVRKPGYLDENSNADAVPGTTLSFGPHLKQLGSTDEIRTVNKIKKLWGGNQTEAGMGAVAVRTNPKGAQISVNQRLIDKLSPAEFLLNPGNYIVEISATGYKPVRRVINVEKSSKLAVDETLEKQ